MHAMTYPYPQGTLSAIEAVDWLARRRDDERTIWSAPRQEAWREICEAIRKGTLPAYVLDSARQSHEADRAQFAALGDQEPMMLPFRQFASTTLESLDTSCFPRNAIIPGMTRISPPAAAQCRPIYGLLFFFKGDLGAALPCIRNPRKLAHFIALWLLEKCPTWPEYQREVLFQIVRGEDRFKTASMPTLDRARAIARRWCDEN
jgi:hypothetical protein